MLVGISLEDSPFGTLRRLSWRCYSGVCSVTA